MERDVCSSGRAGEPCRWKLPQTRQGCGKSHFGVSHPSPEVSAGESIAAHAWLRAEWVKEMNAVCKRRENWGGEVESCLYTQMRLLESGWLEIEHDQFHHLGGGGAVFKICCGGLWRFYAHSKSLAGKLTLCVLSAEYQGDYYGPGSNYDFFPHGPPSSQAQSPAESPYILGSGPGGMEGSGHHPSEDQRFTDMISHAETPSPDPGLPGSLQPIPGEAYGGGPSPPFSLASNSSYSAPMSHQGQEMGESAAWWRTKPRSPPLSVSLLHSGDKWRNSWSERSSCSSHSGRFSNHRLIFTSDGPELASKRRSNNRSPLVSPKHIPSWITGLVF